MKHLFRLLYSMIVILLLFSCTGTEDRKVIYSADIPLTAAEAVEDPVSVEGRYRGFNLQGLFKEKYGLNSGFNEQDFRLIHSLGFNYVRLAVDYLTYTDQRDWFRVYEKKLKLIDEAVLWGQRYGIHVTLNLHQAPGYCVHGFDTVPESQRFSLWEAPRAADAFSAHWQMFAERYAAIPPEYLSFNLINEPDRSVTEYEYMEVMTPVIQSIRTIDPDRPVILDGTNYATNILSNLNDMNIIQSLHIYQPFAFTHYKAEWIEGADAYPFPQWPPVPVVSTIYGPMKTQEGLYRPFVIYGSFPAETSLTINVNKVSTLADLVVSADGQSVFSKRFEPGPGNGEWKSAEYFKTWGIYINTYDTEYTVLLEEDARSITLEVKEGDWLSINELQIEFPGGSEPFRIVPGIHDWGIPPADLRIVGNNRLEVAGIPEGFEERFNNDGFLNPWTALAEDGTMIVGEFGVYNETSHELTLHYLEDRLQVFKEQNMPWALWEFTGAFGIFNSRRSDVEYEEYEGYLLDRKMLELLQRY